VPWSFEKAGTRKFLAAAHCQENLSSKLWPQVPLFKIAIVQRSCFCEKVPLAGFQLRTLGLLRCCGIFPSAPWAWLVNKSGKLVQINQLINAVCESSNRKLSNACRGLGECFANEIVSNWFRRSGRKSLKSLTSNSTGHRLAFLKFCGSFKSHYLSVNPNTLPVSCGAVIGSSLPYN